MIAAELLRQNQAAIASLPQQVDLAIEGDLDHNCAVSKLFKGIAQR